MYYIGSVSEWSDIQNGGARRRTDFILQALVESRRFKKVFVVRTTYPLKVLSKLLDFNRTVDGVKAVYITGDNRVKFLNRIFFFLQTLLLSKGGDIVWCYWPGAFTIAKQLRLKGVLVFDADHNIIGDINRSQAQQQTNKALLKDIGNRAALVISGSRTMNDWMKTNTAVKSEKIMLIRNGISSHTFEKKVNTDTPSGRTTITYIGVLSNWVEYSVLVNLARRNPNWDFKLVGQKFMSDGNEGLKLLEAFPNVYFLGQKNSSQIQQILSTTHVGLVLYKQEAWLDGDSMKIYEYLLAGVNVVSTPYHPFLTQDFEDLIYTADTVGEFESRIEECLTMAEGVKLEWKAKCQDFLQRNTWQRRVNDVLLKLNMGK